MKLNINAKIVCSPIPIKDMTPQAVINHPSDVKYLIGDEEILWKEGESRLIDIGSTHAIYNNSAEYRVHLIIHSDPIDQWSVNMMRIVCRSYLKELGKKYDT